jgi:hypothetical protein
MNRNHQLDFFRGLLLIIITIDHSLSLNNIIRHFTHEFIGWVSAAEGFVFLSGLTAGLVYTYKAAEKGQKFISGLAIKRARTIYRNHFILLLFVLVAVLYIPYVNNYWAATYSLLLTKPMQAIFMGSLLVYQPAFLDILPMYAVFILLVPFAIKWFRQGYASYVLLGSFTLYALAYSNRYLHLFPVPLKDNELIAGYFNILCWQTLFVTGLFAGFAFHQGKTRNLQTNKRLFYLAVAISATFFLLKNAHIPLPWINLDYATDKPNLGPLRIINFAALCGIAVFVSSAKPDWLRSKAICYLGKYSLEVFTFHLILLILLVPIKTNLNALYSAEVTHNLYFYPFGSLFVLLVIVPMLFAAPTIFNKVKKPVFSNPQK